MFSKRHWKVVSLGCISFLLTVGFSAVVGWHHAQPSNAQSSQQQAAAIARDGQSVDELLSLLPPIGQPGSAPVRHPAVGGGASAEALAMEPGNVLSTETLANPAIPSPPSPIKPLEAVTPLEPSSPEPSSPEAWPDPLPSTYEVQIQQQKAQQEKAQQQKARSKYGHLPYAEANYNHLTVAGYYGSRSERLHVDAAEAYQQMRQAARRDGVGIIPVSGFRDVGVQADLFTAQTQRQGSPERAARISAPPGHSEHHTGYAIDLGDEGMAHTDLEVSFEQTPAFRWLAQNAGSYGFELSFPPGNAQNVMYEPWHWRFVGSLHAQKTFALAR